MRTARRTRLSPVFWFLLPWALIYGAFFVFPFVFSFVLGFLQYNPLNVEGTRFVGADNVARLLGDREFHGALRNTLFFVLGTVPVTTALALALAWLLRGRVPMKDAFKAAMFLPSILSMVVIALLFKLFYAPGGALNAALAQIGLGGHGWLTDPRTALPAIMAMDVWAAVGYYALVLYAALYCHSGRAVRSRRAGGRRGLGDVSARDLSVAQARHRLCARHQQHSFLSGLRRSARDDTGRPARFHQHARDDAL